MNQTYPMSNIKQMMQLQDDYEQLQENVKDIAVNMMAADPYMNGFAVELLELIGNPVI